MSSSIDLPPLISHRGAAAYAPENTLSAIRVAKEKSAQWVEFDVQLTKDDCPVVFHDATLARTTSGEGQLSDYTLADLKQLDAGRFFAPAFVGEPIPTLEEAVRLCAQLELGMNIEFKHCEQKADVLAAKTLAIVDKIWPSHLSSPLYSSYDFSVLAHLRKLDPNTFTGLLLNEWEAHYLAKAKELNCYSVHLPRSEITSHGVNFIQSAGYKVLSFVANEPEVARNLLNIGVNSIFSDFPDLL